MHPLLKKILDPSLKPHPKSSCGLKLMADSVFLFKKKTKNKLAVVFLFFIILRSLILQVAVLRQVTQVFNGVVYCSFFASGAPPASTNCIRRTIISRTNYPFCRPGLRAVDLPNKLVRQPFTELLTVNAFVRSGDAAKQVLLVYVLMSSRRKKDYKKVSFSIYTYVDPKKLLRTRTQIILSLDRSFT